MQSGDITGNYKIIDKIGSGGMGEVYRVCHIHLGTILAMKTILPDSNTDVKDRLLDEGRAMAKLIHPNILRVTDFFFDGEKAYLVMEFVDGKPLSTLIKEEPGINLERRLSIFKDILKGVSFAHKNGILHRDLKPANIMVGSDGTVRVMDFGLAKFKGSSASTLSGQIVGTPKYMSPEQCKGLPLDVRSDIYSLGLLGYFLFSSKDAFDGGDSMAVMMKQISSFPEPLNVISPDIPHNISLVIEKCLQKKPPERFQSVDEILSEIEGKEKIKSDKDTITKSSMEINPQSNAPKRKRHTLLIVFIIIAFIILGVTSFAGYRWYMKNTVLKLKEKGDNFLKEGKTADAISSYNEALKKDKRFLPALINRGIAFSKIGNLTDAKSSFESALTIEPDSLKALKGFFDVLLESNNIQEAENILNKMLKHDMSNSDVIICKIRLLSSKGENEGVIEEGNKLILSGYNSALCYFLMGNAYLAESKDNDALSAYDKAIEIDKDMAAAYNNRGAAKIRLNDLSGAEEDLRKAVSLDRNLASAYFSLGITLEEEGKLVEAKANFLIYISKAGANASKDVVNHLKEIENAKSN